MAQGWLGQKRWNTGLAAALALALLGIVPWQLVLRFAKFTQRQQEARFLVWRSTLHLIAAYPVFGCGLGSIRHHEIQAHS